MLLAAKSVPADTEHTQSTDHGLRRRAPAGSLHKENDRLASMTRLDRPGIPSPTLSRRHKTPRGRLHRLRIRLQNSILACTPHTQLLDSGPCPHIRLHTRRTCSSRTSCTSQRHTGHSAWTECGPCRQSPEGNAGIRCPRGLRNALVCRLCTPCVDRGRDQRNHCRTHCRRRGCSHQWCANWFQPGRNSIALGLLAVRNWCWSDLRPGKCHNCPGKTARGSGPGSQQRTGRCHKRSPAWPKL